MIDVLAAALVGASLSISRVVFDAWRERRRQKALHEYKLERILDSPELEVLGAYLDNDLGVIDVGGYATDAEARQRVDRVLGRLRTFLGPTGVPAQLSPAATQSVPTATTESTAEPNSDAQVWAELPQDVRKRLDDGDEWAALVLLRSRLERQVREYLRKLGEELAEHAAPSRLVGRLADRRILNAQAVKALSQAMSIMNRAAHGAEISAEDVQATLRVVGDTMRVLRHSESRAQQRTIGEAYGDNPHDPRKGGVV